MEAKRMAVERGDWGHLPRRMLEIFDINILPCLSNASLLAVELVCKDWRKACAQRMLMRTGTCFVKLYRNACEGSDNVLNTLQIHNPLRREWYPAEKLISWTDGDVPGRRSCSVEGGNNGLLCISYMCCVRLCPMRAEKEHHVHILVFNPVCPERRNKLPVLTYWRSGQPSELVVKMVQSEDDSNAAEDYSILVFIKARKQVRIFCSREGSWTVCKTWPRLRADPLQNIVSIRRSCSGGRLYCLFQRTAKILHWSILSCSIWRFELGKKKWTEIVRLPKRVLKRTRKTLNVTLVGCGDRLLIVVIALLSDPPEGETQMDEEDEKEEEGETVYSDDYPVGPRPHDVTLITLVEVWECVGYGSTTRKARWLRLSQMPAEHVEFMLAGFPNQGRIRDSFPLRAQGFTVLDAEGSIYFCFGAAGRCNRLVMFDSIEESWHRLDRCPVEKPRCALFPQIQLLTLMPNKDAVLPVDIEL